jgi:hypothetical protein
VAEPGFDWGTAGFGGSMPAVFRTWVGLGAKLRPNCSDLTMCFGQGIDKTGFGAFHHPLYE